MGPWVSQNTEIHLFECASFALPGSARDDVNGKSTSWGLAELISTSGECGNIVAPQRRVVQHLWVDPQNRSSFALYGDKLCCTRQVLCPVKALVVHVNLDLCGLGRIWQHLESDDPFMHTSVVIRSL